MNRVVLAILSSVVLATTVSAQQSSTPDRSSRRESDSPRTLTLTGCVEKGVKPNSYTIVDDVNGKYEVSGSDIKRYLGQRVQVAGTPGSTRFRIRGGLWPTPNVAAQGGAIDPARAAIAAQPGGGATGTGDINLPTLKVKAVRTLDGACG
ncbi:MAG: hypothetical protein AB7H96_23625 [Vicinamibacterales bacterium]